MGMQIIKDMAKEKQGDRIEHFSSKDILISCYGAFFIAIGFIFKGNVLLISEKIDTVHMILIVLATLIILIAEIFFMGYSRVANKKERPFAQFLVKRVTTIYLVSLLVCIVIVLLYNIDGIVANGNHWHIIKIIVCVSFPASIGAAATDLIKKF